MRVLSVTASARTHSVSETFSTEKKKEKKKESFRDSKSYTLLYPVAKFVLFCFLFLSALITKLVFWVLVLVLDLDLDFDWLFHLTDSESSNPCIFSSWVGEIFSWVWVFGVWLRLIEQLS